MDLAVLSRILVLNAGSSSLKASLLEVGRVDPLAATAVEWGADATRVIDRTAAVERVVAELADEAGGALDGVGHRIVHGGTRFSAPTLIDDSVLTELDQLADLAPLHNPVGIDTARAARVALPGQRHVAVFDTAFHALLPPAAVIYPLPWRWHAEWGVRRFGFHGLSVAWSVRRAAQLLGRPTESLRIVVAHLGSGCSVSAIDRGRPAATSMGMTPLEGLMMGTRAGSFDPGIALDLLRSGRLSVDELAAALEHESGLLGVSGVSGDVRQVEQAARAGDERAQLALEIFVRRAGEGIAASASALPALDALVFTGGIGEHAAGLRARIVERLGVLGVAPIAPNGPAADALLSAPGVAPAVLRVGAREDVVIAEAVASTLG